MLVLEAGRWVLDERGDVRMGVITDCTNGV